MIKNVLGASLLVVLSIAFNACNDDEKTEDLQKEENKVAQLSEEMKKVRDYVPKNAVLAHRGTTFWAPEETEAAFRWAREIGADYLEADLQVSKDGVLLALHDDNLKRTTDIEVVFGATVPVSRTQYYLDLGYTNLEAQAKVKEDKEKFVPYAASSYMYSELMQLDAGSWFNKANTANARKGFTTEKQYISTLEDLIAFARGKKVKRDAQGKRIFKLIGKTGAQIKGVSGTADEVKYTFEYENDAQDTGNRPGIYIEFKEPSLNPEGFEQMVYDELDRLNFNCITKPSSDTSFYKNTKVNVGNTNGKVILQTFSKKSLTKVAEIFKGQMPMCFLLWKGKGYMEDDNEENYTSFINLGVENKAHIIGPSVGGAPNNYPDINKPFQADLIKKSGMLNHPYSFDTTTQMKKYYEGLSSDTNSYKPPYLDAMFTNRSELTIQYFIDKGVRNNVAKSVLNPELLLDKLGYEK